MISKQIDVLDPDLVRRDRKYAAVHVGMTRQKEARTMAACPQRPKRTARGRTQSGKMLANGLPDAAATGRGLSFPSPLRGPLRDAMEPLSGGASRASCLWLAAHCQQYVTS
jgi:hypothetical protein